MLCDRPGTVYGFVVGHDGSARHESQFSNQDVDITGVDANADGAVATCGSKGQICVISGRDFRNRVCGWEDDMECETSQQEREVGERK